MLNRLNLVNLKNLNLNRLKDIFSKKTNGIGIEIAPEQIKIVQLRQQKHRYKLVNYAVAEIPEGVFHEGQIADSTTLAELIRDTLAAKNIKTKRVATSVPMREAIMRIIPLPAELDDQELRDMVLNHEAALYLPYPREEVDLDYQKLGVFVDEDEIEKVQVLLIATRREVTDTYLDTFAQAGLQVDVVEINSFSLLRTIREQLRPYTAQEATVIIDLEFDSTEIAIVVEGVPQFSRTVPIGVFQMQSTLSRAMNLPPSRNIDLIQGMTVPSVPVDGAGINAKGLNPGVAALLRVLGELTDELRRSLDFYLNQSENLEVVQLFLAGPGGGIGQIEEFFSKRLGLPTTILDPVAELALEVDDEEIPSVQRSGLGTVLGLGLRWV